MAKNTLVIFGGSDNEEQAARKVASSFGCAIGTATVDGTKVNSNSSYSANGFILDDGDLSEVTQVVIFESSLKAIGNFNNGNVKKLCDHHNPGDFGYNYGSEKFWEGSSLGQLCELLGAERTHELELVAAGDHCPVGAYLGQCPGIDPKEFLDFRVQQKVEFYAGNPRLPSKTAEQILADMESAKIKLQEAKLVDGVRDLRQAGKIEELPEAAMSLGFAYMASLPDTDREGNKTGNVKFTLGGHTTPEIVKNFIEWGNSLPNKVGNAYGNPTRGFAGVVVTPE